MAENMGYRPNPLARGLTGGKTETVGILWSLGGAPQVGSMVQNISLHVLKHGYTPYLANHFSDLGVVKKVLSEYAQRRVDAVIIQLLEDFINDSEVADLLSKFRAVIGVNGLSSASSRYDVIVQTRTPAIEQVAEHFWKTGRRQPAYLGAEAQLTKTNPFWQRLRKYGITPGPQSVIEYRITTLGSQLQDCWEILDARFTDEIPFDALFCGTDEDAIVAMRWLAGRGKTVPRDVALIGFNNNPSSHFLPLPLASVDRRDREVAEVIERMLFARLADPKLPRQVEEIAMRFVWRESAG